MSKVLVNTETLTSIADAIREKTFSENTYKPAEMPAAIRGIVGDAFDIKGLMSGSLEELYIPYSFSDNGVVYLSYHTFAVQPNLTSITFEEGIREIRLTEDAGSNASPFFGCGRDSNNIQINLPSTIEYIDNYIFADVDYGMTTLSLPEGLEHIGEGAFRKYSATSVNPYVNTIIIPASVKRIEANAFYGVSFRNVYFKGTPEYVGGSAFYEAHNPIMGGGYSQVNIYAPWSVGNGPTITGVHADTKIHYNYKE